MGGNKTCIVASRFNSRSSTSTSITTSSTPRSLLLGMLGGRMGLAKEVQELVAAEERVAQIATASTGRPRGGRTRGGWLGARRLGRGGLEVGSGRHGQSRRRVSIRGHSEGLIVGKGSFHLGGIQSSISLLKGSSESRVGVWKSHKEDNSMELIVSILKRESRRPGFLESPHSIRDSAGEREKILIPSEVHEGESPVGMESGTSLLRSKEDRKSFPHLDQRLGLSAQHSPEVAQSLLFDICINRGIGASREDLFGSEIGLGISLPGGEGSVPGEKGNRG
ncbi:hypothetical protein DL96DRAFT_1172975 [Flagelloscypha sp. PMI_526]|nr:hypothetical protein DL96DRAFT_1172975 [Flagelloscypha sp. PMI_526]